MIEYVLMINCIEQVWKSLHIDFSYGNDGNDWIFTIIEIFIAVTFYS